MVATKHRSSALTARQVRSTLDELEQDGYRLRQPGASDQFDADEAAVTECPTCGDTGMQLRVYRSDRLGSKRAFFVCPRDAAWMEV